MPWFTACINILRVFSATKRGIFDTKKLILWEIALWTFSCYETFDGIMPWFTARIIILRVFSAAKSPILGTPWAFPVRNWAVNFLFLKTFWRNHALIYRFASLFWETCLRLNHQSVEPGGLWKLESCCEISLSKKFLTESCPELLRASFL